jgi:predicted N-acetyltransferase YhbS
VKWYQRKLPDGIDITQGRPEYAAQLEELQRICFPTLSDAERFQCAHFLKHLELFEDGQFVALDGPTVVGATSTLRLNFDLNRVDHSFGDIIQGGWLTSHQPDGQWLYGADVSVRPEYRGRGLATALYAARQELVWRLHLKGQVTAGMIPGYGPVKNAMSAEAYYEAVLAGRIRDPTLSMQMKVGFEPRGLLANYLHDPVCDNYGVLLVLGAEKNVRGASREHATSPGMNTEWTAK